MTTAEHDPTPDGTDEDAFETSWKTFLHSRQALRAVMSDDELRAFGINLDEYDRKPEPGDFR